MPYSLKQKLRRQLAGLLTCMVLLSLVSSGRTHPNLDFSSPLSFFTNTANLFLQRSGYPFTITNVPIYPTNYYTPALHRLLQLSANIYDASTNRAFEDNKSPNGPFYPTVFRPTFRNDGTNVFIAGYVETTPDQLDWTNVPLSLPKDLDKVTSATANIYDIPYVIGARKGFPNFNEFSAQSVYSVFRRVQIVKPSPHSSPDTFQTNVLYSIGISNLLGVEVWNSYSNNYTRAVELVTSASSSMVLYDDYGPIWSNLNVIQNLIVIGPNQWPGTITPQNPVSNSFLIPLLTNWSVLPQMTYHRNQSPRLNNNSSFDNDPTFIEPHWILRVTNHLQFVMLDVATGRIIDYVSLGAVNYTRDFLRELASLDSDPAKLWANPTGQPEGAAMGIRAQVLSSLSPQTPPPSSGYWELGPYPSISVATQAFLDFYLGSGTANLAMQAPLVASRNVYATFSLQANDPLVHYTLGDLTLIPTLAGSNIFYGAVGLPYQPQSNLRAVNIHFLPWGRGETLGVPIAFNIFNPAVKDPLISSSDGWNFPNGGPLTIQSLGSIHRGTPWQTIYLKSAPVDINFWQIWTGDTNLQDAALSQPTNDWNLVAALVPLLNPLDPHQLVSINETNPATWTSVFQGMNVLSNGTSGVASFFLDTATDGDALGQIITGIDAQRNALPAHYFARLGDILSVPEFSMNSPFLNKTSSATNFLSDAVYESFPTQLISLLRPDSIGVALASTDVPQFQFTGVDGLNYYVQTSTNLRDWVTVATQQHPTNGVFSFSDVAATNLTQRYFRTVLAP